jgi:hypothetical protein
MCQVVVATNYTSNNASRMIGIIAGPDRVITHGPVFVKVSTEYVMELGLLLIPSGDTVCRPATGLDKQLIFDSGGPRVRVTSVDSRLPPGMAACFIN